MDIIKKIIENLDDMVEYGIEDVAITAVADNADLIIEVLQDKQLGKGMYYDGSLLGEYSPYTQDYADEEPRAITPKPYGDPYNFQWTGDTFAGMYIKTAYEEGYTILTRDGKQEFLKAVYGDELFKLSEENNDWINKHIIEPEILKFIEENWFLAK